MSKHTIKLPRRTATVTIRETKTRTFMKLRLSKYGTKFGDEKEFAEWLEPIPLKFDGDSKPIVMDWGHGRITTAYDGGFAIRQGLDG